MYNLLCLETAPAKGVLAVAQQVVPVSALPGELLLQLGRPSHQHLRNTVAHDQSQDAKWTVTLMQLFRD